MLDSEEFEIQQYGSSLRNKTSIFDETKFNLTEDTFNAQSVGIEKLSINCKNDNQTQPKNIPKYSSPLLNQGNIYSQIPQPNYPKTPLSKKTKNRFHILTPSPAPIDHAYRRRIRSNPSSPCSSNITSPFLTPTKEKKSLRKTCQHHQTGTFRISPKKGFPIHFHSKSDPSILFPKNMNLPSKKSKKYLYSDRYIPSRVASALGDIALLDVHKEKSKNNNSAEDVDDTYSVLLRNTMLNSCGRNLSSIDNRSSSNTSRSHMQNNSANGCFANSNIRTLRFRSPKKTPMLESPFSLSPVGVDNQRLFCSPRKASREIPQSPFRVLDAPSLKDDFYLNLVDWSKDNLLAVTLKSCVYLWCADTRKVTKLCDLGNCDSVSSLTWDQGGTQLAVATHSGEVQIWNTEKCKRVKTMKGHVARVGVLAWNNHLLASGSRDRMIYLRDPRSSKDWEVKLQKGHNQEVCGLKWSFDGRQLASGGNDNKLLIWNVRQSKVPIINWGDHTAAIKAIAWSPHQNGLLASGGGTYDRCIRFRNTLTGKLLNVIDTGSQVCNLIWSKNVNEIVSTHGYSLRGKTHNNQIILWKYPTMTRLATLKGHTYRVLYLALSPDGQTIVTGAGDETLRFWNIFPSTKSKGGSLFFLSSSNIR